MEFFKSRTFIWFFLAIAFCAIGTTIYAVHKQQEFAEASELLDSTHAIIFETQDLSNQILSLLALQRGYLLTENEIFLSQYKDRQTEINTSFNLIRDKISDNEEFKSELEALEDRYIDLVVLLDMRAASSDTNLSDTSELEAIKEQIRLAKNNFLENKYTVLNSKITRLETIQASSMLGVLTGIIITGTIMMLLNYYLFHLRRQNRAIGYDLSVSEERLQYALMASGEGVFDWDLNTDYIYCSDSYINMLGNQIKGKYLSLGDFMQMVHPEDLDIMREAVSQYVENKIDMYSVEFRMRHADGYYIWVNSRAHAVRNEEGKAIRLIGIHRDITQHKAVEENLEKEAWEAEQLAAAKSEFLAHMSHEIRTPLTTISGISEILEKKQSDFDDRTKELINTLNTSVRSLKELINDILDFSKIEKGEVELENGPFLLGNMISEVISIMSVQANEKGLTFKVLHDEIKYYEYYGDSARIKQILLNLIGNAIKFTDKGAVTVMASIETVKGSPCLSFAVQDTGVGIEDEMIETVFREFKQGDNSVSRKYGGTGLGLPISKELASLMGGSLHVESKKGLGSTFTLYLPIKERGFKLIDEASLTAENKVHDQLLSVIQEQQRVLIVEDYEGNIVMLSYLMEEIVLNYDIARSGKEALEAWKNKHYDIILMDVQMPEMDGMQATREIRSLEAKNKFEMTPVIGMTAHALVRDKDKCLEAGMTDYISKPIRSELLKEKILHHIDNNQVSREQKKTGTG